MNSHTCDFINKKMSLKSSGGGLNWNHSSTYRTDVRTNVTENSPRVDHELKCGNCIFSRQESHNLFDSQPCIQLISATFPLL